MARSDPGRSSFEGYLDSAGWDRIVGWARFADEPGRRATVEIIANGAVIHTMVADDPRPDLVSAGKGDGRHGFQLTLPKYLVAAPVVSLLVREQSTGLDLANTPQQLLNDAAGLDRATQAFLADRVAALADGADGDAIDDQAAFLLTQFDRLVSARMRLSGARERMIERVQALAADGPDAPGLGGTVAGTIGAAVRQYGNEPIVLPTSDAPEVSVVIPARNAFRYTHACLRSIAVQPVLRAFEVILVDDGSSDETVLAALLVSGLRVVRAPRTEGFVGAVTRGVAAARGQRVLLLNNDTEVGAGWLDALCGTMDRDASVGVVGAKLLFPDGSLQESGAFVWRNGDGYNYGRGQDPGRPEYRFMRDVDYVSGAAMLVRRDVWDQVGGLGPEYAPGYYEDTDLCFKVREAGWRVVVQTTALVMHHEGASSGTDVAGTGMKRHQRANMTRFAARWAGRLRTHAEPNPALIEAQATRGIARHALFIDDTVPTPDRDAGSNAAVAHMLALQRLGWHVHFVPSHNLARIPPYTDALERVGIRCHDRPYTNSVEELLRRNAGLYGLVYLHRLSNARYMGMVRACNPDAQVIYSVADLHHLRMMRDPELARDPALRRAAQATMAEEMAAAADADCTIVHSSHEAAVIAASEPRARVMVVPWTVEPCPAPLGFAERNGLAFVGGSHPPNIDAAEWLVTEVMPLVWAEDPGMVLHLVGEHAEHPRVQSLPAVRDKRVRACGWVPDFRSALGACRLTVAPLRYGAGLKGKLLDSFALGLPCVPTSCAAEGADLPAPLSDLVSDDPAGIAALILALHGDAARNAHLAEAGLRYIEATCAAPRIDALMALATKPAAPDRADSAVVSLRPIRPGPARAGRPR